MITRYSRAEMSALWSDEGKYTVWLEVEIAALEAMVTLGEAPHAALEEVRAKAKFDVERIAQLELELKHDVIAFLTCVREYVGDSARFLHLGMTSSDLLDTAFAIQLKRSADLLLSGLDQLLHAVQNLAQTYKYTPCIGRSHGIHAEPTTFGLKCAGWYAELARNRERLERARAEIAAGKISGPVGTFAHLSPRVEELVCQKFDLLPDPVSTQVVSRDRHAAFFSALAIVGSTLERIAVEIRHLQRTEVREAEEFFSAGQKGSSAMPHKRNPILSENITGLTRLLRAWAGAALENVPLWHERDISHSSVERVIAPDATITLDFMLARMTGLISKLVVSETRMEQNLNLTRGLVYSGTLLVELTKRGMSREDAYGLIQKHALATWEEMEEGPSFRQRIEPEIQHIIGADELDEVFSPARHIRHVDYIFKRVFK